MNKVETISVIGLGYIGLPTAAMFASRRIKVIGVDVNPVAVDTINEGRIHIVEPELDMIVHASVKEGYLEATLTPKPADAFLIAVPTPFLDDHQPDMSYVKAAVEAIAPVLAKGNLVILESTSPVGATEQMLSWLADARPDLSFPGKGNDDCDVHVAYCPERVLPGQVVRELVLNDRIIGGVTPACANHAAEVYSIFVTGELLRTDSATAEMCKLTENAFRDVNIAFANELSMICDKLDINVWELIRLANHHPRVNILQPGCGVGGHCIAVDPWFIVSKTPDQARLIRTAREVNDAKPGWVVEKVRAALDGCEQPAAASIVCFGLAFKPDIDDLRESPAVEIVRQLAEQYPGRVKAVEPHIAKLPASLTNLVRLENTETALATADIIVLLVDHKSFRDIKLDLRKGQKLVDARGIWS